jgi:hypothetical protein
MKSLGMESRHVSDAAVHLYAAALRGLSIDLLFKGREETIDNAVMLLESFMRSLFDHHDYHVAALPPPAEDLGRKPRLKPVEPDNEG